MRELELVDAFPLHQSGINAIDVRTVKTTSSYDNCNEATPEQWQDLVLTGGDDGKIILSKIIFEIKENQDIKYSKINLSFSRLSEITAHSSQVTGL